MSPGPAPGEVWEARLFLAFLAVAPLPLGGNRPWAWTTFGLIVAGLLVWRAWRGGGRRWPPWLWGISLLALVAPAWALLQALPLMPAAWHHPAWAWVETGGTIAAVPEAAVSGALRLLTYGGAFFLAWHHGGSGAGAARLVRVLTTVAAVYAAYGLVMLLSGADLLLWWEKTAYRGVFTATFVNRNAAAAFIGLGLLLAVVAGLRAWRREDRRAFGWAVLGGGLCALALLLSQSRGGLIATAGGLIALSAGLILAIRPPWARLRRLLAGAGLAAVVLAALAGGGLFDRLAERGLDGTDRQRVHGAVLDAVGDRPWLGQGLGSFDLTFPAVRPAELGGHWDLAHSTVLELIYELGLPAALCWFLACLGLGLVCLSGLRLRRRRQEYPALGVAALVLAGLHGLIDFPFQMPANALWLAAILGVATAQSMPTRLVKSPLRRAAAVRASASPPKARR